MSRRLPLLLVLLAPAGCFQKLATGAADNTQPRLDAAPPPTTATTTPEIELDFEGKRTTTDPCVATTEQAREILTTNCAGCHGGGPSAMQGQPPFDCVLDFDKLKVRVSEAVKDPRDPTKPMRFLIPGDPDNSRLYVRVAYNEMPPKLPFGLKDIPRPTISDISVLREWISHCMGSTGGTGGAGGASTPTPPGTGGAGGAAGASGGSGGAPAVKMDAAPAPAPAPPPDARPPSSPPPIPPPGGNCGGAGQTCCAGNVCNAGGCCVGGQCHGNGQACVGLPGMCNNGSCQGANAMACGGAVNQQCCGQANPTCTGDRLRCVGGQSCQACGGANERCCQNGDANACIAGFECQPQGSINARCVPCGGMGQVCCGRGAVAQQTCNGGLTCTPNGAAPPTCR